MYLLYETTSGFFLFFCGDDFSIQIKTLQFENFINNFFEFFKKIKFRAFIPFKTTKNALDNLIYLSKSFASKFLADFLYSQISMVPQTFILGIEEPKLANYIFVNYGISTIANQTVFELIRGIRLHCEKLIQNFISGNPKTIQCGMAHIFSRFKMNLSLQKTDIMIIQSYSLIEQIEKDINFFCMNAIEWYSWHFPELTKILNNNYLYMISVKFIGNKKKINLKKARELCLLIMNEKKGNEIFYAAKTSVGSNILPYDLLMIEKLSTKVILMIEFRNRLSKYLNRKLNIITPNLVAILGENLTGNLITKAGSLYNLAKFPSSTVQILGAEKALFRALKKKGKTPKYGILFNSSFISKTDLKDKGKISRYLANKCSLAIRIDYFSALWTNIYGKKLKNRF
ncbi:nucleolar protein (nucleomorph) [Chroomonas mesostigmatica CCMP1168]|uniref:Nucleolar protein 56 n=1 Tax=Chroomonas mesostigmatica CCMP1168 TaxID=1195612 RepID=J7GB29_9CRYP|nr:nucleolar protein [Chroomonas mesostigmatica CCMP1168]